jgi:hypothetical protein
MPDCQQPHPGSRETTKGALLITPIVSTSLEHHTCPICHEAYSGSSSPDQVREPEEEGAVSVDMIAEWYGLRRLCGHVIGRTCLEKHITAPGAWRNKCPICRCIWYHDVAPRNEQQQEQRAPQELPRLRRSRRLAAQRGESQAYLDYAISERDDIRQVQHRLRPGYFTQQLLRALEVEDGTAEVKGTLEEVEQRLKTLYEGPDV